MPIGGDVSQTMLRSTLESLTQQINVENSQLFVPFKYHANNSKATFSDLMEGADSFFCFCVEDTQLEGKPFNINHANQRTRSAVLCFTPQINRYQIIYKSTSYISDRSDSQTRGFTLRPNKEFKQRNGALWMRWRI